MESQHLSQTTPEKLAEELTGGNRATGVEIQRVQSYPAHLTHSREHCTCLTISGTLGLTMTRQVDLLETVTIQLAIDRS